MKYSVNQVRDIYDSGSHPKFIFFWGNVKTDQITRSCFSQWYEQSFEIEGNVYYTAEHWMMAEKARLFNDMQIHHEIINTSKPGKVKELGRMIRNFDQQVWDHNKYDIVVKGNLNKFSQNESLKKFLLSTNDRILVEASPLDRIRGIGLAADDEKVMDPHHWEGTNLLGFALMDVRDLLKQ